MNKKETIYLGIGGNIENRYNYILETQKHIEERIGEIIALSPIYETPPWGFKAETNFLNRVAKAETTLNVNELLIEINEIEKNLNRQRSKDGYISRTADIDILFYGSEIINTPNIEIPHPRLHKRNFVLLPLNDIASDFIHPVLKKTIYQLIAECNDKGES